ncbi:MAG: outer-membrane lipoprotein carrier protein LolA [Alphaproteobacteria bacterium]
MKNIIFIFTLLFACNVNAQSSQNIKTVETYLNTLENMSAKFVQTASNGNVSDGILKIAKPNKIRMEYNDPTSVLIVGDGDFIVYYDKELDQTTHINYDDIPASLILANDIKIDGKQIKVVDFYQDAGITSISLQYLKNDSVGPIKLIFENSPMELKQWSIVDPQGVEILVSLYDVQKDVKFDDNTFKLNNKKKKLKYKK